MLIAQISDTHAKAKGRLLGGVIDTHGMLMATVKRLAALDPRPDAVLHTGDVVDDGDAADYAAVAEALAGLAMPVLPIPGNHDRREMMRQAFGFTGVLPAAGPLNYVAEVGPVRVVALDSLVEGAPHGRLGTEQIAWLRATLAERPDALTLVMVHHPPFETGIAFMDSIALIDAVELADVIGRHPQVERVLCGHVHRSVASRFAGTIAQIAPGAAHQIALGVGPSAGLGWTLEPPSILLHALFDGAIVTHQITVEAFPVNPIEIEIEPTPPGGRG
jgi:3',5'-cyclic AMP phosphodiesterase CpdA